MTAQIAETQRPAHIQIKSRSLAMVQLLSGSLVPWRTSIVEPHCSKFFYPTRLTGRAARPSIQRYAMPSELRSPRLAHSHEVLREAICKIEGPHQGCDLKREGCGRRPLRCTSICPTAVWHRLPVRSDEVMLNKPNGGITCGFHALDLHPVVGPTAPGSGTIPRADRRKAHKRCPRTGRCERGYGRIGQRLYQLITDEARCRPKARNQIPTAQAPGCCCATSCGATNLFLDTKRTFPGRPEDVCC